MPGDPRRHGAEADWIAFIDADEFLLPAAGAIARRLPRAPRAARRRSRRRRGGGQLGGLRLLGQIAAGPGPVIERFARRAERTPLPNHHFKSILRTAAGAAVGGNPHAFRLAPPFRRCTPTAATRGARPGSTGLSREVVWEPLRLNHYVVKSREEFLTRKLPRGRATSEHMRDPGFFDAHDRNEVTEHPIDPALAQAMRLERARIAARLAGRPGIPPEDLANRARGRAGALRQPARPAASAGSASHFPAAFQPLSSASGAVSIG